jgi:hypothetical protein
MHEFDELVNVGGEILWVNYCHSAWTVRVVAIESEIQQAHVLEVISRCDPVVGDKISAV